MLPLTKLHKYICNRENVYTWINDYLLGYTRDYQFGFEPDPPVKLSLNTYHFEYTFTVYSDNYCSYSVFDGMYRILYIEKIDEYKIKMIFNEKYYGDIDIASDMIEHDFENTNSYFYRINLPSFTRNYTKYYTKYYNKYE